MGGFLGRRRPCMEYRRYWLDFSNSYRRPRVKAPTFPSLFGFTFLQSCLPPLLLCLFAPFPALHFSIPDFRGIGEIEVDYGRTDGSTENAGKENARPKCDGGKCETGKWFLSVPLSLCRLAYTQIDSPGSSTRRGQRTFRPECTKAEYTCWCMLL